MFPPSLRFQLNHVFWNCQTTVIMHAPVSAIPSIIGTKGANLNQIRDSFHVKVDIPRRETLAPANGHVNGHATPQPNDDEEQEEPTMPITLTGSKPLVQEAQAHLNEIIAQKTAKTTQRAKDIPQHILPFVLARRPLFISAAQGAEIDLKLNKTTREISIIGEREAVRRVVDAIKRVVEEFNTSATSAKISLPKRQHRLLAGDAVDAIMAKSKCSVVVAHENDPSDEVLVWGLPSDLAAGLGAVMEMANSQYIHEFPLPGPATVSKQLVTYMHRIGYVKTLAAAHPDTAIYPPTPAAVQEAKTLNLDIIGEKPDVDAIVKKLSEFFSKLIGGTTELNVDWLVHRTVAGKNAKK